MIIDASQSTKEAAQKLHAAGVKSVGRYYSKAKKKNLTKSEAMALCNEGITIFTVYEDTATPNLDSKTGKDHAERALKQAANVGQPKGSAIYFAFDSDLDVRAVPGVKEYFKGVKSVVGLDYKLGVYGDGTVCKAMLDSGTCDFAWLSASRGHHGSREFYDSRKWSLAQDPKINQPLAGVRVDFNEANGGFGDFSIATSARKARLPTKPMAAAPEAKTVKSFYTEFILTDARFDSAERISDPQLLEPATRASVMAIIADAKLQGINLMIFETYRSTERQAALFDQGATKLKQVGVHHYGLACDLVKNVNGEPSWKGDFSFLGHLARQHQLVWGGDWGRPDIPHSFHDNVHVQRVTVGRQPSLFSGAWYPDQGYDPYKDGAR